MWRRFKVRLSLSRRVKTSLAAMGLYFGIVFLVVSLVTTRVTARSTGTILFSIAMEIVAIAFIYLSTLYIYRRLYLLESSVFRTSDDPVVVNADRIVEAAVEIRNHLIVIRSIERNMGEINEQGNGLCQEIQQLRIQYEQLRNKIASLEGRATNVTGGLTWGE